MNPPLRLRAGSATRIATLVVGTVAARAAVGIHATGPSLIEHVVTANVAFREVDVIVTAQREPDLVQKAIAASLVGIGQANITTHAKGAAGPTGAVTAGATTAIAALKPIRASAAGAALTLDHGPIAAILRFRVIQNAVAANLERIVAADVSTDAKSAADSARAIATATALAIAAFESLRAFSAATAIALFDDDASSFATAGCPIRAAFARRLAPVFIRAAEFFAVAVPETTGAVTAIGTDQAACGPTSFSTGANTRVSVPMLIPWAAHRFRCRRWAPCGVRVGLQHHATGHGSATETQETPEYSTPVGTGRQRFDQRIEASVFHDCSLPG